MKTIWVITYNDWDDQGYLTAQIRSDFGFYTSWAEAKAMTAEWNEERYRQAWEERLTSDAYLGTIIAIEEHKTLVKYGVRKEYKTPLHDPRDLTFEEFKAGHMKMPYLGVVPIDRWDSE